jgi:hypothetical protein
VLRVPPNKPIAHLHFRYVYLVSTFETVQKKCLPDGNASRAPYFVVIAALGVSSGLGQFLKMALLCRKCATGSVPVYLWLGAWEIADRSREWIANQTIEALLHPCETIAVLVFGTMGAPD